MSEIKGRLWHLRLARSSSELSKMSRVGEGGRHGCHLHSFTLSCLLCVVFFFLVSTFIKRNVLLFGNGFCF